MVIVEDLYPEVINIMKYYILDPIVLKRLAKKFRDRWIEVLDLQRKLKDDEKGKSREEKDPFYESPNQKYEKTKILKIPRTGAEAICIIMMIQGKSVILALTNNQEDYPPTILEQEECRLDRLSSEKVARALAHFVSNLDEEYSSQSLVVGLVGNVASLTILTEKLKRAIKNFPVLEKIYFTDFPINEATAWLLEKYFRDPDTKATLQIDEDNVTFSMVKRVVVRGKDKKDVRKVTSPICVNFSAMETMEILGMVQNKYDVEATAVKKKKKKKDKKK